ncbi:MAG: DNA polymerase IV [Bacteroidota bacterium]|nr:DNA polymerase IV [Bacteroidota bacterium]
MDAFYASIEQRDFPQYKGKPLAVGGSKERGVVAAASYEARKFGVFSAMASKIAFQKCPDIIFVNPRFEVYKKVSKQIMEIFFEYTDLVEPLSLDEAYLDVTYNKLNIVTATQIAIEIKEKIKAKTQLTASAGISFNKFLAKTASDMDKPDGLTVVTPNKAIELIEKLPIEKFYGVGKVTAAKFYAMGVFTGADLINMSKEELIICFGKSGKYFYQVVRLEDDRPVQSDRVSKSVGAENTFEKDITEFTLLMKELKIIAEILQNRLERKNLKGKTIILKIKYSDFTIKTRSLTVKDYLYLSFDILTICERLLESANYNEKPVRLLGISVSNLNTENNTEKTGQMCFDF